MSEVTVNGTTLRKTYDSSGNEYSVNIDSGFVEIESSHLEKPLKVNITDITALAELSEEMSTAYFLKSSELERND